MDTDVVAYAFILTPRRIQQMTQEGIITGTKIKGVYKYDLVAVTRQYIKHIKADGKEDKKKTAELEFEKLEAETKLKQSKADIAALELNELEGNLHSAEDVEAMTTDLVFAVKSMLLAFPGQLAVDVANMTSPTETSNRIREAAHKVLEELSNYRYDPVIYMNRVRERQGWREKYDYEDAE